MVHIDIGQAKCLFLDSNGRATCPLIVHQIRNSTSSWLHCCCGKSDYATALNVSYKLAMLNVDCEQLSSLTTVERIFLHILLHHDATSHTV